MDGDAQTSASVDEDLVKQPLMEPRSADSAAAGWSMWLGYSPREKYDDDDDDDDLVVDPLSKHEANGKTEQPDEEDEDKAPLGLLMGVKDFQLAFRLCQMTLIYEPTNPEASEILPLLQQKLLEGKHRFLWNTSVPRLYWECILLSSEQGTEESSEEEDDSERDERSSCTPTSSCSSSSSDTDEERRDPDDDEQEKHA
uniref:Glutamate rich 2 n=1 Tax=Oryzias melastigma TaxID=30732 RepID=A0A3B3D6S2_ORYME